LQEQIPGDRACCEQEIPGDLVPHQKGNSTLQRPHFEEITIASPLIQSIKSYDLQFFWRAFPSFNFEYLLHRAAVSISASDCW
jgi:hypothetical protein